MSLSARVLSTLLFLSLWLPLQTAFIKPLTLTPLRPFSVNQNYTTDYCITFNVPSTIPLYASFEVEFPIPYQLPSICKASIKIQESPFTKYPCEKVSNSKYLVNVGTIISGDYQIVFENIINPSSYPASSNFKIRTYFNKEILVDANEHFESVPFLPTPGKFLFIKILMLNII